MRKVERLKCGDANLLSTFKGITYRKIKINWCTVQPVKKLNMYIRIYNFKFLTNLISQLLLIFIFIKILNFKKNILCLNWLEILEAPNCFHCPFSVDLFVLEEVLKEFTLWFWCHQKRRKQVHCSKDTEAEPVMFITELRCEAIA